tara:strand:- start:5809 stop:7032 length:1224 start_codon:yes stop_codon:yes gene_type:complete
MKKRLLIYESIDSGHRLQHPVFLVSSYLRDDSGIDELHVLVPEAFRVRYQQYFNQNIDKLKGVHLVYITEKNYLSFGLRAGGLVRAWRELMYVREYVVKHEITYVHLDNLNRFFYAFLAFRKVNVDFGGIYYAPFPRREKVGKGLVRWLKFKLSHWRKVVQLYFVLRFSKLKNVYILNDTWSVDYLNSLYSTNRFRYLVDPVWIDAVSSESQGGVKKERFHFLIFGTISVEKGIGPFFDGLSQLAEKYQRRIKLHIAGRVREDYRECLNQLMHALSKNAPMIDCVVDDRFLSVEDMIDYFSNCDVVVNTNIRTQSASGIMGHAAAWGKPAISSSTGLYGVLAKEYHLGPVVDPFKPEQIRQACCMIIDGVNIDFDSRRAEDYCNERQWYCFGGTILNDVGQIIVPGA